MAGGGRGGGGRGGRRAPTPGRDAWRTPTYRRTPTCCTQPPTPLHSERDQAPGAGRRHPAPPLSSAPTWRRAEYWVRPGESWHSLSPTDTSTTHTTLITDQRPTTHHPDTPLPGPPPRESWTQRHTVNVGHRAGQGAGPPSSLHGPLYTALLPSSPSTRPLLPTPTDGPYYPHLLTASP